MAAALHLDDIYCVDQLLKRGDEARRQQQKLTGGTEMNSR